jgi:methionyl-tRNA formyltransferase
VTLRVVFMGSPEIAVPTLKALHEAFEVVCVMTQPDRPSGRGRKSRPTAVKEAALEAGLPVEELKSVNTDEVFTALESLAPDVIVVAAFGQILPKRILELPPMGCVNLHASLLPKHRGASPIAGAILAGDAVTGITTMLMDEGMDTGDILLRHEIPIADNDTAGTLHDKMLEPGASLTVDTLRQLNNKTLTPAPQDNAEATYTKILTKEDGRIDWRLDAIHLDRIVRAFNPWPGAFATLQGNPLKIRRSQPGPGNGDVGVIQAIDADGITVGTGAGALILKEVQAPGKKWSPAADFARGRRIVVGDAFDIAV